MNEWRRYIGHAFIVAVCAFIWQFGDSAHSAPAAAPTTSSSTQPNSAAAVVTRGVFKSDRGDFPYTAYYWPGEEGRKDKTANRILDLLNQLEKANTFEQFVACYSSASLPYLQKERASYANAGAQALNPTTGAPSQKRISHLIVSINPDGSDLYVVRSEQIDYESIYPRTPPQPIAVPYIDACRGHGTEIKLDTPAREDPVYEAVKFGEWKAFGLPDPPPASVDRPAWASTEPTQAQNDRSDDGK